MRLALALQQLLQQDAAYAQLLAAVETHLAKKLRFQRASALLRSPAVCGFLDALAQLRHVHRVLGERVGALAAAGANDADMEERIVAALAEMLRVVRFQYGQLFCRAEAAQSALEAAAADATGDAAVLRAFLEKEGLSVADLVMRPLQRFHALVEFVEALSPLCQDTSLAPRLLQLALDTRQYIHTVQSEVRDEQELVALQAQFEPSAALPSLDLSAEKLLLHGEVGVAALRVAADTMSGLQAEKLYAHCFQGGKLVYSRRNKGNAIDGSETPERFAIQGYLELKQDPVFLECVPGAALRGGAASGAIVLISNYESVVLGFEDPAVSHQWSEAAASLLSQNEVRSRVLRSQRSFDDIQIPLEVSKQLKLTKRRDSLVPLPSFHDDDLPGIFWLRSERAPGATWELVELMFYDHWLLVSKVVGWKHHSLLHHLDCRHSSLSIQEAPSEEGDWGLVVTSATRAEPLRLHLASQRRSRVDFWFDQISKTISKFPQAAPADEVKAADVSKEQATTSARAKRSRNAPTSADRVESGEVPMSEPKSAAEASDQVLSTAKKTPKKRKASERELQAPTPISTTEKKSGARSTATKNPPSASKNAPLVRGAVEGGGEGDDAMVTDKTKLKKSRKTDAQPKPDEAVPTTRSPAIKTPKRRWLKLKEEDLDDSSLLDTDISQDTVESSTRDSRTSQSQTLMSTIRIILTGIDATPAIRKKIKAIGGAVYEDDVEKATHVVAPKHQLKRTVKLLCGISRCEHIVDEKWLDDSARAGAPLSEQAYCLLDTAAQEKWHFDLHKTMYEFTPAQRRQLFVGHTVFITNHKSVLPPVKDLVKIVECAGGRVEVKGSAGPSDVVITSEAALGVSSVHKSLARANPQRIYSPELILSSILQQHIDFDANRLEKPFEGSKKRR